ncbi:unnamed protein product [Nezara viridula]|uniref:Uncharacterized protein n=1 Tax=Nezara viridula TaxID=85310 RepID=A0A9P0H7R2_NEZVI|nr:unnamed protein product [Nezara viridula]
MADEIASAMEQEMVEEQAIKCPRPSAKRQRKGSPDAREETDKERVDDSLLQDARRIKENIRVYMNATDRNVSAKVQKHVNGKIQQLIDIMETIYDKNYEKTFLVQRVVKDTLASSEMYDIIVNALVEKAVPMVIEGLKSESKTIQRPLSEPQTSREFPCVKEQPLLADAHAIIETTENESFQEEVYIDRTYDSEINNEKRFLLTQNDKCGFEKSAVSAECRQPRNKDNSFDLE